MLVYSLSVQQIIYALLYSFVQPVVTIITLSYCALLYSLSAQQQCIIVHNCTFFVHPVSTVTRICLSVRFVVQPVGSLHKQVYVLLYALLYSLSVQKPVYDLLYALLYSCRYSNWSMFLLYALLYSLSVQ